MKKLFIVIFLIGFSMNGQILDQRERAVKINEILKYRFENLLPKLMDQAEIDMWILISREYNEDPVLKTMLPAEWLNARRRTILVFYRNYRSIFLYGFIFLLFCILFLPYRICFGKGGI